MPRGNCPICRYLSAVVAGPSPDLTNKCPRARIPSHAQTDSENCRGRCLLCCLCPGRARVLGPRPVGGSLPHLTASCRAEAGGPGDHERDAAGIPQSAPPTASTSDGHRLRARSGAFFPEDCCGATQPASWLRSSARRSSKPTQVRLHGFREAARRMLAATSDQRPRAARGLREGVNAGLASLATKPFEYLLLGEEPAPGSRKTARS